MKTPPKKLIILIFFICFSFFSSSVIAFSDAKAGGDPPWLEYEQQGYRCERIFDQGQWWVYVYDEDGNIFNIYEDEQ